MKAYNYSKPGVAQLIDKENQSLQKVLMLLLEWSKRQFVVQTYTLSKVILQKYLKIQHLVTKVSVLLNQLDLM